jgi:uncharacterized protein with PIN domain
MLIYSHSAEKPFLLLSGVTGSCGGMKFIADAMLGRLAKWMRLLGCDVVYHPDIEDGQLVRIAREEGRILLTRDTLLLERRGLRQPIFIRSDDISQQLLEIRHLLNSCEAEPPGKCPVCNGSLEDVPDKVEIRTAVPDFVYLNHNRFLRCSGCGKVYWEGTHYRNIRKRIREISGERNED